MRFVHSAPFRLCNQVSSPNYQITSVANERKARRIMTGLGFSEAMLNNPVGSLSGGWRTRCDLGIVLLQNADVVILDEPTNFLDLLGIMWLQSYIIELHSQAGKIVVLVSHDRAFIDATCKEIIILRDKSLAYFSGNLTEYEADLRSRIKYLGRMQEVQEKEAERIGKTIRANIKLGKASGDDNKLRMAKSRQKKLDSGVGMLVNATGGRFKLSKDRAGMANQSYGT